LSKTFDYLLIAENQIFSGKILARLYNYGIALTVTASDAGLRRFQLWQFLSGWSRSS
jgi:hypothetical protein